MNTTELLKKLEDLMEYAQSSELYDYLEALSLIINQEHMFENKETFKLLCKEAESYINYIEENYKKCVDSFSVIRNFKSLVWKQ